MQVLACAFLSVDGAKEYEIVVSDFQSTVELLKSAGLPYRSLQESKRETWKLGDAEIVLDEWPWLNPYVEIEGNSEAHVREISEQLGFDWENALFGDVMAAYRVQYPHLTEKDTVGNILEVNNGAGRGDGAYDDVLKLFLCIDPAVGKHTVLKRLYHRLRIASYGSGCYLQVLFS